MTGYVRQFEDAVVGPGHELLTGIEDSVSQTITLSDTLVVDCPLSDDTPEYSVEIEYRPSDVVIEAESLSEWFGRIEEVEATQEAVCEVVHRMLYAYYAPEELTVRVVGHHRGIEIETVKHRTER